MPPTRSAAYGGSDASSAAPRLNLPPHQSSARSVTATVASTTSSSSRAREMLHAASTTAAGRRSTPRTRPEDDVLADSSSSSSASSSSLPATRLPRGARQQLQQQQQRNHLQQAPTRRIRRLSPDRSGGLGAGRPAGRSHAGANARSGKSTTATSQSAGAAAANEELEFVNRQPDGNFLLGLGGPMGGAMAAFGGGNMTNLWKAAQHSDGQEDDGDVEDAHYSMIARKYFTAGYAIEGRGSKQAHADLEETRVAMMARLREQTMQRLDETRWLYEPTERFQPGLP